MIPNMSTPMLKWGCKPRASGDDPSMWGNSAMADSVNPARAGMIPGYVAT